MPNLKDFALAGTLALVAGSAHPGWAQQGKVVVAKTTMGVVADNVVQFVARSFRPITLTGNRLVQARFHTPRQQIMQLCGTVSLAYIAELDRLNKSVNHPLDTPLGTDTDKILWPACLRVALVDTPPPPAAPTGQVGLGAAVGGAPVQQPAPPPSQPLAGGPNPTTPPLGFVPVAVELSPIDGLSAEDAADQLRTLATTPDGQHTVSAVVNFPTAGHIVDNIRDPPLAGSSPTCPAAGTVLDAKLIESTYGWSQQRQGQKTHPPGSASIYVVDNGFFGVERSPASPFGPAFPSSLFWRWSNDDGIVGSISKIGNLALSPINYFNDTFQAVPSTFVPDEDEAHGTHVAGLTLGGPSFEQARNDLLLQSPQNPLVNLTIINIGNGERDLAEGSEGSIQNLLGQAMGNRRELAIVNMSVAYQGSSANQSFDNLFSAMPQVLFVVAAGNDSQPADVAYVSPGMLGNRPNVISVAAHDMSEPSQLAWFTNFGPSVDIAAPGCGVVSWSNADNQISLTGTSQAAPIVTFAAALLGSLDGSLTNSQIRTRILVSGELLGGGPARWNVQSGSKVDISAALLLYDDILKVHVPDATTTKGFRVETWIGQVTDTWGLRCTTDGPNVSQRIRADLWAFKRQDDDAELFVQRLSKNIAHCPMATTPPNGSTVAPLVKFRRVASIINGAVVPDQKPQDMPPIDMTQVESMVFSGVS